MYNIYNKKVYICNVNCMCVPVGSSPVMSSSPCVSTLAAAPVRRLSLDADWETPCLLQGLR